MVNRVKAFERSRKIPISTSLLSIGDIILFCQFKGGLISGMVRSKTILAIRKKFITFEI